MDQVASQSLKHIYGYCYQQALSFNITVLPSPDTLASMVGTVGYTLYQNSPESLQAYYNKVASVPIQINILPLFLSLVVLYIIFSLIMATLRGVFRLVYNIVRFTLLIGLVITLIGVAQQYYDQDSSIMEFVFSSLVQFRNQYVKVPSSSV